MIASLTYRSLDIKYASLNLVFGGKVLFTPLKNPQQILDIGTGTGIWAIDCGEEFPGATGNLIIDMSNAMY